MFSSSSASPTLGEHRVSPPRTPPISAVDALKIPRQSSTSPSDDSSIIELSFDYELDSAGNYVRISKGSSRSNNSTPPTPHEILLDGPLVNKPSSSPPGISASYAYVKPPSPILLNSPAPPRNSLSQSDGAYSAPSDQLQHRPPSATTGTSVRSFQRVASGPAVLTPAAQTALRAPTSTGLRGTGRKLGRPQRIPLGEQHVEERDDFLRVRGEWDLRAQEEKENIISSSDGGEGTPSDSAPRRTSPRLVGRSASLSQVDGRAISGLPTRAYGSMAPSAVSASRPPLQSGRQIMPGPNRAGRILMGAMKYGVGANGFDKISEYEGSENEAGGDYAGEDTDPGMCAQQQATRPNSRNGYPAGDEPQPLNGQFRHRSYAPTLTQSTNTRPRRSASLSDASAGK
ncbi:hypothetical protein EDC04DRAFT_1277762 [Pisolithus marmoratus]|nr:hypothetical protein EDC04DRAFT_1277762 [Pisolithus marmoratus]